MNDNVELKKDESADGLRGIASLSVFICHFLISFYPLGFYSIYPGTTESFVQPGIISYIIGLPFLSALWNGTLAVSVFFVLSGYVLTKAYYETHNVSLIQKRISKRYFRFFLPVLMSVLLSYAIIKLGFAYGSDAAKMSGSKWLGSFWNFESSFSEALKEGLYNSLFIGKSNYTPTLWTMKIELIGSLIVLAFTGLKSKGKGELFLLALVVALIYSTASGDSPYYFAFIAGGYLNMLKFRITYLFKIFAMIIIMYLGSYDNTSIYNWCRYIFGDTIFTRNITSVISGFLLVLLVINGFLRDFLELNVIRYIGKLSFSIYLIHFPIILSLSSFLYIKLNGKINSIILMPCIFFATLTSVIIIAHLFMKLFDEPSTKIASLLIKN